MEVKEYFPCFTTRAGEIQALEELADPTKDRLFPIVRLQAWPRPKNDCGGPVQRSIDHLTCAFGVRPIAVDLAQPRNDLDSEWGMRGRQEISELHDKSGGSSAWCDLIEANSSFIPTVQWSDDLPSLITQINRLVTIGRGIVLRFRKSQAWNLTQLAALQGVNLTQTHLLLVFDYEQIGRNEDLTVAGTIVQSAILAVNAQLNALTKSFVFVASSFPSQFAEIHPEYANLPIRERQIFEMLRQSIPIVQAGITVMYGDHAAVFATDREPAFRGAPRADYPTRTRWIYHRRPDGFLIAAQCVVQDPLWNHDLLCWGAQRIRLAAAGNMVGLNAQTPWVTIRINIHLHLQAHFNDDGTGSIDEQWVD